VVQLSEVEGVGPQLYWVLSKSERLSLLPKACQDRLRAMFTATRLNNLQILDELNQLTALFSQQGIPVVALKGICFALTIYPDIGMRPMVDLDLLVPRSRLQDAIQIAYSVGYEKAFPEAAAGSDELLNNAACLVKTQTPFTTLELHYTLVGEAFLHAVPVDWFWTQLEPLERNSASQKLDNCLTLTPTAQLLHACAHAMLEHGGQNVSLRWMYDLDRLVRVYTDRLDWPLFLSQAQAFEWSSAALAALFEVTVLFGAPVPQAVLTALAAQPDQNTGRIAEMKDRAVTRTLEEYQKFKSLKGKGRVKLVLGLAVPSPAYMRWRYGVKNLWTLPFWYLYRWWGILMDGIHTIFLLLKSSYPGFHPDTASKQGESIS
jgi:hypothetical protein